MEVGQGPNFGCSTKGKKYIFNLSNETQNNRFRWIHHVGTCTHSKTVDYRYRETESTERSNLNRQDLTEENKISKSQNLDVFI
jgi:hypothetical protein